MTLSAYDITVPAFIRGFGIFQALLAKGEAHAVASGLDPQRLVEARLAPDMLPLAGQVQRASDTAKASVARLTGIAAPSFADEEKTFADLDARIRNTVDFLASADPAAFAGAEDRTITTRSRGGERVYVGRDYILQFALPNFYFHLTTGYDILRANGVAIGKGDYLGL